MLFTVADFAGEYRLDRNAINQTDYQQAIDAHELELLRTFFDEQSIRKIYSVPPTQPPAIFVRDTLRPLAIPFIFFRVRMGITAGLPGEPKTQGYEQAGFTPRILHQDFVIARTFIRYFPYFLNIELTSPSDTFTIAPADSNILQVVRMGDEVEVLGVGTYSVISVTASAIQISATLPAGVYSVVVKTLRALRKHKYITI